MLVFTHNIRQLVLWSLAVGGILCLAYDIIRVSRWVFSIETNIVKMKGQRLFILKLLYTFLTDVLFCIFIAVCILLLSYYLNGGLMRGLTVICMAVGFIAARLTVSRIFTLVIYKLAMGIRWVIRGIISISVKILKIILKPVFLLYHLTLGRFICIIKDRVRKKRERRRMRKSIPSDVAGEEDDVAHKGRMEAHNKKERILIGRRA